MAEYIDTANLKFLKIPIAPVIQGEQVHYEDEFLKEWLETVPTEDVAPVIHAKWERVGSSSLIDPYRCSNCHKEPCKKQIEEYKTWGWDFTDYCPHCGAKMDEE